MKDLILWIAELESTAGNLYANAAEFFSSDRELSAFLKDLELDEILHYDVVNRIGDMLAGDLQRFRSVVALDTGTRDRLEEPLISLREHLSRGTLTQEGLFDAIVAMEFSEWNDIFIYIIDALKECSREFQYAVAQLESHKRKITHFIEKRPGLGKHLQRIKEMKQVWRERILIVDDEPALVKLLMAFLGKRYEMDSAMEGNEALQKIISQYYDLILSDINLPGLNGIEIFNVAFKGDSSLKGRYLFMTGDLSAEYKKYFEHHEILYLYKPVSLDVIEKNIQKILNR